MSSLEPDFIPDKLDYEPVVLSGCTGREVTLIIIVLAIVFLLPSVLLALFVAYLFSTMVIVFSAPVLDMLFVFLTLLPAVEKLSSLKADKPKKYYQHAFIQWCAKNNLADVDYVFRDETFEGRR